MPRATQIQGPALDGQSHITTKPLGSQKIQHLDDIHLFRNNLTALSRDFNYLFIAVKSDIYVYAPSFPFQTLDPEPLAVLKGADSISGLRSAGYIPPQIPNSINFILIDYLGDEEVLLSADDDGYVCLWYTSKLLSHFSYTNTAAPVSFDMWFDVQESAWGLAVHRKQRLLAVSCNAKIISIFELGETGLSSNKVPGGTAQPIKILGHSHNIPFISFVQDDPSGRWICATDIGGHVSLLDAQEGVMKSMRSSNRMGWSVNMIPENNFKWVSYGVWQSCIATQPGYSSSSNDEDGSEGNGTDAETDYSHADDNNVSTGDNDEELYGTTPPPGLGIAQVGSNDFGAEHIPSDSESSRSSESVSVKLEGDNSVNECSEDQIPITNPREMKRPQPSSTLLVHTNEADIFLFGIESRANRFAALQKILHPIQKIPFVPHMFGLIRRLNMVQYIPALSLLIIACQGNGSVVLVRLLRAVINKDGQDHIEYFLNPEVVLPSRTVLENNHPVALAGIAAGPQQGFLGNKRRRKGIRESRWRLLLTYSNGQVLAYELYSHTNSVVPALL